jgi:hypothetical protein
VGSAVRHRPGAVRISGNTVDILGGHEDAIQFNPTQRVLPPTHARQ